MVADQPFTVDLYKPLVFQVGHLGEAYDDWVHQPIVGKESPRFFANGFMEFLTRTRWWVIPLIWLPVVCWSVQKSVHLGLTPSEAAIIVVSGIIAWTLMEYCLHRFLFHIKTTSYWSNTFHYLIHGCHHKHPMDAVRLVFPPAGTAIISATLWNLIELFTSPIITPALYGGILLGYVMYDVTHYYLHHGKPLKGVTQQLKRFHMDHHFKTREVGFGITSSFWDSVFGTLPLAKAAKA